MDIETQQQYAETFRGLHRKADPLVLFNAWDVATSKAIARSSPAVATSSAAVAAAFGFADGENVPLDELTGLVSRMTAAVSVPVSIDLEAGYGETPEAAAESVTKILRAGAIGINIEDGLSRGTRGLVSPERHAAKMVKFQQRYVMSRRNVINCLWGKAFRQFCSSHGGAPVSRSVLGA